MVGGGEVSGEEPQKGRGSYGEGTVRGGGRSEEGEGREETQIRR